MDISPIPGIRALPVTKTPPVDPRLSTILDVENPTAPDDDTYSGNRKQTAECQDDEDQVLPEEEAEPESQQQSSNEAAPSRINVFA